MADEKEDRPTFAKTYLEWHGEILDAKGERAELRRCGDPRDAVFCRAYHRLKRKVRALPEGEQLYGESLCVLAYLGVQIQKHLGKTSLPAAMANDGNQHTRVSPLRFRRLLEARDRWEFCDRMMRVLPLLDREANMAELAKTVRFWNENSRRQWAETYYDKLPAKAQTG